MGESDGEWGQLHDEQADAWDSYDRLPDAGSNAALDHFCTAKRITIPALVKLGARLSADTVLAFAYPGGVKYRDIVGGRRWNYVGSEFTALKLVRATTEPTERAIVAEGETDAARLTLLYPDCDVAALPAGARRWLPAFAEQLRDYRQVLVGLDADDAGEAGARAIIESLPQAHRFTPPEGANDWCDTDEAPPLPEIATPESILVSAGDLLTLEAPAVASWYEHDILPIGGLMIVHGWVKTFKTYLSFDLLAALSQGVDWLGFEPLEEPCRVAIMQFELPWSYLQKRVAALIGAAREPALLRENFMVYSPIVRPQLVAGDTKAEDVVLRELERMGIQVFLLDPVRRAMGMADMNAENEARRALHFFERINDLGISVIATHHDNKAAGRHGGGNPLGMTGTGAWSGDADTIVSIEMPPGESADSPCRNARFTLRHSAPIGARGFVKRDDRIVVSPEPFGIEVDPDAPSI